MSVRRTFLTGLIIVLPVFVTYWVLKVIFGSINSSVTPVIFHVVQLFGPGEWVKYAWVTFIAPIVSVSLAASIILMVGLVGGNMVGRQVLKAAEALIMRVPVVRGIYSATRQFIDTFSRPDGSAFRSVVLVEFPRPGAWSIAFLTSTAQGEVQRRAGRRLVAVFVPTTPNPTGGYLLFVPEESVIKMGMSVDDALKMVISGGILTPEQLPQRAPAAARHDSGADVAL